MSVKLLCACACMMAVSACAWHPLTIQLHADTVLNKNQQGQSTPVAVKLFQLNRRSAVEESDVSSLWARRMDDRVREVHVDPGETARVRWRRLQGARYLAVVANFRSCESGLCVLVLPLGADVPVLGRRLSFHLDQDGITRSVS